MRIRSAPKITRPPLKKNVCVVLLAAWMGSVALAQSTSSAPSADSRQNILAQAQAERDAQQWNKSLDHYRKGKLLFPNDAAFDYGEIYVLADSGKNDEAVNLASNLVKKHPGNVDVLLVASYAQLRANGGFAALEYIDRALQADPERRYVVREYVMALQRTGMASQALEIADRHPDLLTAAQYRNLQADAVAETVRFSRVTSRSESERFNLADQSLGRYDALFAEWRAIDGTESLIQRARIDRLQALYSRAFMSELISEYESLKNAGVGIPLYSLGDVASAYLYLRKPEEAEAVYTQLIDSGYMRTDERARLSQDLGLMYSLTDQGRLEEAQAHVMGMKEAYPQWRYVEGEKARVPNESYLEVQHTATMVDLYANQTDSSQKRLKDMVDAAPWNNSLRTDLAWAYRIRGWPRLAEEELKIAESYEPRSMNVEINQGQTAMALKEWRQAELLNEDAITRFPESPRAKKLAREWEVHNLAELQVSAYKGLSKGGREDDGSPVRGSQDFGIESTIYTAPINYNWRLFAGAGHRTGKFRDDKAQQNFGRVGLEWRSRDWWVEGEVSNSSFGHGSTPGARAAVVYDVNDYWQLSAAANWRSRATPLRALYYDITSNSIELGVRWRQSDLREWSIGVTPSRFSDGNNRTELIVSGKERLITRPKWYLDLGIEAYAAHNSKTDTPYYSPRNEIGITPVLHWNHTIYQRYESQWTQRASVGIGGVNQDGYGTGVSQFISYGQRYKHNDVFETGATISGLRRPYDGVHEREWRLVFDMTYRF